MNQESNIPYRATADYARALASANGQRMNMRYKRDTINAGHRAPLVLPVRRFGGES